MSSDAPPEPGPARQSSQDLDAEWEEFNKSGCPDFMLASKYVSNWAHNNLPNAVVQAAKYVPFLSQMVGEGHPPGSAGQQQQRPHAGSAAAAAVHPTNADEDQHAGLLHQARPQQHGQQQQHGGPPGCGAPLKGLIGCASCSTGTAEAAGGSAAGGSAGGGSAAGGATAAAIGAPSHGGSQGPA